MYKTKLQEMCDVKSWSHPKYTAIKYGPDHSPRFTASVFINDAAFNSPTSCKSMKEAQNKAAEVALMHFISLSSARLVNTSSSPGINQTCSTLLLFLSYQLKRNLLLFLSLTL